jgi:hypothetical protein
MTFRVGQKVVCVDARCTDEYTSPFLVGRFSNAKFIGDMDGLERGVIYTVRAVGSYPTAPGMLSLWLVEIVRPVISLDEAPYGEPPFAAARFRPVVERKTDISIFTAMLDRAPSRETVEAAS